MPRARGLRRDRGRTTPRDESPCPARVHRVANRVPRGAPRIFTSIVRRRATRTVNFDAALAPSRHLSH
jgi:hypothetical protein